MGKAAEIDIVSVSKVYGATTAVDTISLKIPAGTYCCLLGPRGCGKTSTLRMIAGHETSRAATSCSATLSSTICRRRNAGPR